MPVRGENDDVLAAARKDDESDMAISLRNPDDAADETDRFRAGPAFGNSPIISCEGENTNLA
jgi:hypothetical protein